MTTEPTEVPGSERVGQFVARTAPIVLGVWAAARLLVALSFWISDRLATTVRLPVGRLHLDEGLLFWDGAYYRSIAEQGYAGSTPDTVRFFPGYPTLARWIEPLVGGRTDIGLVLLANLAMIAALFLLWKVVTELGHDEATAARAVAILALFPAASVTAFAYAEGPFLAVAAAAVLLIVRRRPMLATAPLFVLGLLRPTGILIAVAVVVTAVQELRADRSSRWWRWIPAALAPAAGQACYLVWLSDAGTPWTAPLDYQRDFRAGFREPVTRLIAACVDVLTGDFRDVYNLVFAIGLIVTLVLAVRQRVPAAWVAYLGAGLLVACSANNIDSLGRYGSLLIPAWPIALAVSTRRRAATAGLLTLSALGLVWFTVTARLGYMIP